MRNNIEERFFEVFGIEPYKFDGVYYHHIEYPQITSDILLKLMCLVVYCIDFRSCKTPEDIKDLVLSTLIYNKDYINKSKVQSLFTEVENEN